MMRFFSPLLFALLLAAGAQGQTVQGSGSSLDGTSYTGTCSATCNGTAIIGPIDTAGAGFTGISVQTTAAGSGTLTAQGSNDNITYTNLNCIQSPSANVPPVFSATSTTFAGEQICPISARYFRLQFTSYSSGTFTVAAYGRTGASAALVPIVGQVGLQPYPTNPGVGQTAAPIIGTNTGSTGAVTATLTATAGRTTYICGFDVSAVGTSAVGPITVGTLIGGSSFTYQLTATSGGAFLSREFTPCIPANAAATSITVTTTADGSATAVDVNAHGYNY